MTACGRAAARRSLFLPHAARQMTRPDRMIDPIEVREVVMQGELIEDCPGMCAATAA